MESGGLYVGLGERKKIGLPSYDDAIDGACCSRDLRCEEQQMGEEDNATVSAMGEM